MATGPAAMLGGRTNVVTNSMNSPDGERPECCTPCDRSNTHGRYSANAQGTLCGRETVTAAMREQLREWRAARACGGVGCMCGTAA